MSRRTSLTALTAALLLANLWFIWGNSALPASDSQELSGQAMRWLGFLVAAFGAQGETVLRKLAHMAEFASLGLLLTALFRLQKSRSLAAPLLLGLLAACVDETIQVFVPGRASSVIDVWIDGAGLLLGIAFALIGQYLLRKRNFLEETP